MSVNHFRVLLCALAGLATTTTPAAAEEVSIGNPSFEDPITFKDATTTDLWVGFKAGAGTSVSVTNSTASPRTGTMNLALSIDAVDNTVAGVFQDVLGRKPGETVSFTVWLKAAALPLGLDVDMRIQWVERGRIDYYVPVILPIPVITTSYQKFTVTGVVPIGADTARMSLAVQTITGGASNTGTIFADDASLAVFPVPEPATWTVCAGALMALTGLRQRRKEGGPSSCTVSRKRRS